MVYTVFTKTKSWDRDYNEDKLYISAESEEEAKEIYKKNTRTRKKVYIEKCNKKGILVFKEQD